MSGEQNRSIPQQPLRLPQPLVSRRELGGEGVVLNQQKLNVCFMPPSAGVSGRVFQAIRYGSTNYCKAFYVTHCLSPDVVVNLPVRSRAIRHGTLDGIPREESSAAP